MIRLLVLLSLLLPLLTAMARELAGQAQPSCNYEACALRMHGRSILAGEEMREIGSFGFLSAPDLRPWIEVSDSASYYVRVIEENYVSGSALQLAAAGLVFVGSLLTHDWNDKGEDWAGAALMGAGYGSLFVGSRRVRRSLNAANDAVWWYNASLSSAASGVPGAASTLPQRSLQNRGLAGLVIGSLVGVAGGLAVSSRHPSSETAEGLGETLLIGTAGAWLGWSIGTRIRR